MKTYSFEKLEAWVHAKSLTIFIYRITKSFPPDEKFGMISQMKRAALSIASNIAEGTSRTSMNDQAHFSTVAFSSTIELLNDLIIANELEFIPETSYSEGRNLIEKQTYLISKLRQSQIGRKPTKPI